SRTDYRYLGRTLSIPELAVGRLVETPEQIGATIDAYLSTRGQTVSTALVVRRPAGRAAGQELHGHRQPRQPHHVPGSGRPLPDRPDQLRHLDHEPAG